MHVEITRVQFNVQYVNVVNRKCCFALYFFLRWVGGGFCHPLATPLEWGNPWKHFARRIALYSFMPNIGYRQSASDMIPEWWWGPRWQCWLCAASTTRTRSPWSRWRTAPRRGCAALQMETATSAGSCHGARRTEAHRCRCRCRRRHPVAWRTSAALPAPPTVQTSRHSAVRLANFLELRDERVRIHLVSLRRWLQLRFDRIRLQFDRANTIQRPTLRP